MIFKMKRLILNLFCILFLQFSFSQPINKSTLLNCTEYILNIKKVKIQAAYMNFNLDSFIVNINNSIYTKLYNCNNYLEVTSPDGSLEELLEKHIKPSYTPRNSSNLKIKIADISVLNNLIPSSNQRLYVSMEFYLLDSLGKYNLSYATTNFIEYEKYIELPLGKLISKMIKDFNIKRKYENDFILYSPNTDLKSNSKIFTSFSELNENRPSFQMDLLMDSISYFKVRSKYFIKDGNKKKIKEPIFAFSNKRGTFLNVFNYYSKDYFTEINRINEDYYFIYDEIFLFNKSHSSINNSTNPLLPNSIQEGITSSKSLNPGFIEVSTGRLTTLTSKQYKDALGEHYSTYVSILKEDNRKKLVEFFRKMLDEEVIKLKL